MRIVIVAGICVRSDAISAAIESQARLLSQLPEIDDVVVIAQHIDRSLPCRSETVGSAWGLLRNPAYLGADVAIYHWGIHYDLFDALALNGLVAGPVAVCHFHNCTPAELVADDDVRATVERSLIQIQVLAERDIETWTFSEFNRITLVEWGVAAQRIAFVPFPVSAPRPLVDRRAAGHVDVVVVGRMVPAKGQHVVVEAVRMLPPAIRSKITVRFAGNTAFGDSPYADGVRGAVEQAGLEDTVRFVGHPNDDQLWRLYEGSHVVVSPSFHEGLCIPVIEGYLAGCRAIGTTAGNLPYVVAPPDPVVTPGDPSALAAALAEMAAGVLDRGVAVNPAAVAITTRYSEASAATATRAELRRLVGAHADQ